MEEINYLALFVSGIAVWVTSTIWYMSLGKQMAKLHKAYADVKPEPKKIVFEIIRNIVLAFVIGYLVRHLGINDWKDGFHLGLLLWIGFPVILLSGSVMWEKVPTKLAVIHAGDWLIKLLVITIILSVWR